jgi:hypothetical protein
MAIRKLHIKEIAMREVGYVFLCVSVCFLVYGLIQDPSSGGHSRLAMEKAATALQIQIMCFSLSGVCFALGTFLAALGTFQANMIKETQAIFAALKRSQGAPKDSPGQDAPENSQGSFDDSGCEQKKETVPCSRCGMEFNADIFMCPRCEKSRE